MPFTAAHPAAILPLRRPLGRFADPLALAIGSMVPDLVLFLPLGISRTQSHSLLALFWFNLPVGALSYLLFLVLVTPLIAAVVPVAIARRLPATWERGQVPRVQSSTVVGIVVSLIVGAVTHLVWDLFTHATEFTRSIPILGQTVEWGSLRLGYYTVLHYLSSLLGLVVLAGWLVVWFRRTLPRDRSPQRRRPLVLLLALFGPPVVVGLLVASGVTLDGGIIEHLHAQLIAFIFASGAVFVPGVVLVGLLWRVSAGKRLADPSHRL